MQENTTGGLRVGTQKNPRQKTVRGRTEPRHSKFKSFRTTAVDSCHACRFVMTFRTTGTTAVMLAPRLPLVLVSMDAARMAALPNCAPGGACALRVYIMQSCHDSVATCGDKKQRLKSSQSTVSHGATCHGTVQLAPGVRANAMRMPR